MGKLLELARALSSRELGSRGLANVREVEQDFVEVITFASADEIIAVLHTVLDEDWIGLPVWARNLAFRLACLQRPYDAALLREAAGDLLSFGPDWDDVAASMQGGAQSPFPQVRRGVEVVGLSVGESAWFGVGVRAATPAGLLCVVELR